MLSMPAQIRAAYFLPGGLLPRPPPDGLPVLLGAFFKLMLFLLRLPVDSGERILGFLWVQG